MALNCELAASANEATKLRARGLASLGDLHGDLGLGALEPLEVINRVVERGGAGVVLLRGEGERAAT